MTPHHSRGVFPITPGASYELIDGRIFEATLSTDRAGVVFREQGARTPTVYLLRESASGGQEVTALWELHGYGLCGDCGDHHPYATPTDFTVWDFEVWDFEELTT
jgi:hypothetical protein